jgi:hypothetical protein
MNVLDSAFQPRMTTFQWLALVMSVCWTAGTGVYGLAVLVGVLTGPLLLIGATSVSGLALAVAIYTNPVIVE